MPVIESTIEGRYQVIARIASGGMGEVYRAHDTVLDRDVAVKVLHAQLAGDRGFVERFRREARAAALLNHPNIVGVYDWGTTDGTYFMVMEFVRGLNLRSLLAEYGRLRPAQVAEVTLQVLAALEHAHGHGIVHRDVKPENILIDRTGRVKVADFGLARAYADSHVSQAEGTVTGTVQYLAPEQVRGQPADPRTDLYALGVVMFELLTGRTPFTGETALAIAYQHLSGRVPPPSALAPGIPPALDRAVLAATEKDPDRRPPSAAALAQRVAEAARDLPPAPPVAELAARVPAAEAVPDDRAPTVTIPRARPSRPRVPWWARRLVALAAVLALLVGGGWAAWTYAVPHYTRVPLLVGLSQPAAERRLAAAGLRWTVGPGQHSREVGEGLVVDTSPPPGSRIRKGQTVLLIPSLGPVLVRVPDVLQEPGDQAAALLRSRGFQVEVGQEFDDTVPAGRVADQNPSPGTEVPQGATVRLVVSKGPPPVTVPQVAGQTEENAKQILASLGFEVRVQREFSNDMERGLAIGTDPPAGTEAPKGSTVTLRVSKGPESFPMPNVVGMRTRQAEELLTSKGLVVDVFELPGTKGDRVVFQDPVPGTTVHQGQRVTIYVTKR